MDGREANIAADILLLKSEEMTRNVTVEINAKDWTVFCNCVKKVRKIAGLKTLDLKLKYKNV
jgi:hypothetical protein